MKCVAASPQALWRARCWTVEPWTMAGPIPPLRHPPLCRCTAALTWQNRAQHAV
eukprot:CAMPEP_0118986986 /NCGR_PEP_ID=MMETSP1173-20130426/43260_1 /TAXON_ID=1034831 /ORGANISM="Rhizochromulina marina cf, Strain CCMP1243" /LENGTH=53 /DNA_ID=CAMNT_0006937803 /DNA_START=218 /DNA_END=376 /DNA_ORIENTATION=-